MNPLSRRTFLTRGSIGVVLAGSLAALPVIGTALKMPFSSLASGARPPMTEPLIAHVRDINTGEIAILFGPNKVIHRDPELAARLYAAARRA